MHILSQDINLKIYNAQIDLIQNTRIYSIFVMLAGAIFVYYAMLKHNLAALDYWITYMVLTDAYRLYASYKYFQDKRANTVNYSNAYHHIIIGSILSGAGWGCSAILLIPHIELIDIMLLTFVLAGLSSGATTTLAYKRAPAYIFIFFLIIPYLFSLAMSDLVMDLLYIPMFLYFVFLLKNTAVFYNGYKKLLFLEFTGLEREEELAKERERAINANAAKSAFLANMSHELRTPMHAILGFSSLGGSKVSSVTNDKLSSYFLRINESGQRLLYLLNDLLDLSKLEAGKMEFNFYQNDLQTSVRVIVGELSPLFLERSLTVDIEPTETSTIAIYDNEKIEQVIRNLLSNAIKFTPDDMSVLIYFEETMLYSNDMSSKKISVPALSVSIMDQGAGIPEEELETVFEKFVQSSNTKTAAGGTGLGLAISKEIIEGHGGTINAVNSTGKNGAIFTFIIPRTQPSYES